ncbi:hypothetical protein FY528_11855 [Hymenobacter lutimineralis]|uniref:Uncharacterized protein n=1 Tax=Hymenobacter lutimineralis TaxID=2606448 RepID=A0A5D6UZ75_9BACT|nr:hypothetical protein [Hymenobacter lutimineralis]TYZ08903.1 hypothetical protein FY528_11855 [Hymenobacter lutimineralis]
MKLLSKLALTGAFALLLAGAANTAQAQINININTPSWGPAAPRGTQYYYIPEIGGYYDLPAQRYIVYRNNSWTRVASVRGYNPVNFHPVILDYRGGQPWVLIREHRVKYPKGGHPHGMPPGQAKKMRAVAPAGRPVYVVQGQGRGNNGNGHGKGHGKGKH